jgi:RHS repeat-associated protein
VGDFTNIVFSRLYDTSVCSGSCASINSGTPALPIGSYWWGIQPQNAAGGGTWSTMNLQVQAPPAPTLSSPSGSVATSTPTFTWSASSGPTAATSYLLQLMNGATTVYQPTYTPGQASCGTTCSVTPTTALTAGTYTWSVKAMNAAGSTWSSSLSFTYGSVPAPPTLVSPSGPMTTVTPTFVWNVSAGATEYWIDVRNASNVAKYQALLTASVYCQGQQGQLCQVSPGVTLAAGDFTWAVQAKNSAGTNWSATTAFTVAGCAGEVKTGDFNGDGFTDRLCAGPSSILVSLATGTGFTTGAVWLSQGFGNVLVADFNSDGRTDIGKYDSTTAVYSVALSNGAGFGSLQPWGTANTPQIPQACAGISAKADVGDFNGDGRPDVSCKLSGSPSVFVGLSNGSSFTFSTFGSAFCETGERTGVVDVNGDGKSDWYCLGPSNEALLVFPSTGTGLAPAAISASDSSFCDDADVFFGDFNGDGKTDVSCKANGRVRVSTGSSFLDIGGLGGGWCTSSVQGRWPYTFGADLDGDGTAEMVCIGAGDAGVYSLNVRKWLGTSLGPAQTWASGFCFGAINVGDFDGDGKTDVLCEDTGAWGSPGTSGTRADLLSQVNNGMGGSTTITYVPSTSFTNNPGIGSRQVARTVATSDGRGPSSTTTYTYANGKVDPIEHMFLGFQSFTINPPCLSESGCPYVVTVASQTVASAGKPLDVRHYDSDNFLATMQTYGYTESSGATLPRTSLLNRTDSYLSGRDGSFLHTYTTYPAYDAYGNLTQTVSYGDGSKANDELETDTTFIPKIDSLANPNVYIVGLPAQVQRKVPGGAALQTEQYEYDGTAGYPAVANWNVPPSKGNLTAVSRSLNLPSAKTVTRRMTYNTFGSVLTAKDETGLPTATTYDATYNLFPITITNPAGEVTTLTWDNSCAAIKTSKDPNNQTTSQTYDPLCRASLTTDPVGGTAQRSYLDWDIANPNLQRTRIETDAATGVDGSDWSEAYFDGLGRTYKTTKRGPADGQDIVTEQTFNLRGGVASSTEAYYLIDGPQRTTSFEYDTQDRQIKTILPDQAEINTSYGAQSQTVTDPNGKATTTRFDAYGRVVAVERMFNGSLATTTTTYDTPLGLLKTMADAVNSPWTWTSDSLGRQVDEVDPDAGHWKYEYDDAGRPTKQTDAKNQITNLSYNAGGRLATKVTPVGTTTYTYSESTGYFAGYFNVGRLTTLASPADTLKINYDQLGRSAQQQRTIGGNTYTVNKTWDTGGYLQSTTYPDGDTIGSLGYDEAGRLNNIPGIIDDITYDAAGRPTSRANSNTTSTTWSYTADRGFLEKIYTDSSSGPLQDLNYTYDAAGLVQSVTSPPFSNEGWTYSYDDFYHLTQATNASNSTNNQSFTYDKVDRITYNSRSGVLNYTYPANGSATRPHAPTAVNGASRTYDANGNLLTGSGQTLTWNGENRLSTAVVGSTTTTFTYDSFGERLKKASGSNTSIYPFGDDYEVTNGVITKYISVDGLGVVAKKVGATTYWIQTDRLGSINVETDSTGTLTKLRRRYRPYGETLSSTGSLTESRGWIDQRNDTETTLTYLHARYFDPKLGQFLSPDPIGVGGGLNLYGYGAGDPVNRTDRTGLSWTYHCVQHTRVTRGDPETYQLCNWVWTSDPNVDDGGKQPGGERPAVTIPTEIACPAGGGGAGCPDVPPKAPETPKTKSLFPNDFTLPWAPYDPSKVPTLPPSCFGSRYADNVKKTHSPVATAAIAPVRLAMNMFGISGAMGNALGLTTPLHALETLVAGSPNSTIAPGSTVLFGEAATVSAATAASSFIVFEGGVRVGSGFEAFVYSLSCRD